MQTKRLKQADGTIVHYVVIEGKIHYVLADNSTVAISEETQDRLNKLLGNQTEIIEYMRESKEHFFHVLEQIEE
mgnify:CR=1 FL=1